MISRMVDITAGKRAGGFVLLVLDTASPVARARWMACDADGETSGRPTVFVNGSSPVNASGYVELSRGEWDVSTTFYDQMSSKGKAYLAGVLGPVLADLWADEGATLADCAARAAEWGKRAAADLATFRRLERLAAGAVERSERMGADVAAGRFAGVVADAVAGVTLAGALDQYGRGETVAEAVRALPWGAVVIIGGRVVGAVGGTQSGGVWTTHVCYEAPRDWLHRNAAAWNAGAVRFAYL